MAYVKVFADKQIDKKTDRQTDGPKKLYVPDLSMQGHEKAVTTSYI